MTRAEIFFPPELLEMNELETGDIDLSTYEKSTAQGPGTYRVDVIVSSQFMESRDVTFFLQTNESGNEVLQPCLSLDDLEKLKIKN